MAVSGNQLTRIGTSMAVGIAITILAKIPAPIPVGTLLGSLVHPKGGQVGSGGVIGRYGGVVG